MKRMALTNMKSHILLAVVFLTATHYPYCDSFVPSGSLRQARLTSGASPWKSEQQQQRQHHQRLHLMLDPASFAMDASSVMDGFAAIGSSNLLLSFADQGQNLAGIFFQASLLPYLVFLYFLSFRGNRLNPVSNFGFQYILLFVLSTIPSGIVSKATYAQSLADTDWLHGGAESLLTVANVLIVLGLTESMTKPNPTPLEKPRNLSLAIAAGFFACLALGPSLFGVAGHAPFLFGIGDLSDSFVSQYLPFVNHAEPANALSIPTWFIHFSSVFEYVFAMRLVWQFSETTNNPAWRGMTWGMLPLHASGVCACTYHFFYNPSSLQFLVSMQAGLTLLGNLTCALAAFRIAKNSGWTLDEVNPFPKSATNPSGLVADGIAATPLVLRNQEQTTAELAAKLIGLTVISSYVIKYGELGLDLPFTPNPPVALAMVLGIPAITAYYYYTLSSTQEGGGTSDSQQKDGAGFLSFLPSMGGDGKDGKPSLSMDDVKKYGVAGTVAYILTELAFWIVAFPVAAYALYESTGHWPDVIHETQDRAAVLAFIFAGANVARLFVPVRLGAALALAPWVDENILSKMGTKEDADDTEERTSSEASSSSRISISTAATMNSADTTPKPPVSTPFYVDVEVER